MDELELVFATRPMAESTKKSHVCVFNKLKTLIELTKPLHAYSVEECMDILNIDESMSASYKRKIISLFIIVKDAVNKTDSDLIILRNKIHELSGNVLAKRIDDFKTEDTNQFEAIRDWIDAIDIDTEPAKYIMNYLLFYINVRNLDLVVKLISTKQPANDTCNYLIYTPIEIKYLRNSYKTKKSHGAKYNSITDAKFIACIQNLPEDVYLLSDNPEKVRHQIKKWTYKNMTETEYLHNVVTHYKGDVNMLFDIEKNRGTDIRVLLTNYNSDLLTNPRR